MSAVRAVLALVVLKMASVSVDVSVAPGAPVLPVPVLEKNFGYASAGGACGV